MKLTNKELLEKMHFLAEELDEKGEAYKLFTKCMADIDTIEATSKSYDPYTDTWN